MKTEEYRVEFLLIMVKSGDGCKLNDLALVNQQNLLASLEMNVSLFITRKLIIIEFKKILEAENYFSLFFYCHEKKKHKGTYF